MRIGASFDAPEKTKTLLTLCLQGFVRFDIESGDPAGIRTQDPNIKSVMLYQLSYGIFFVVLKSGKDRILKLSCQPNGVKFAHLLTKYCKALKYS
jgi:hypothetical protein